MREGLKDTPHPTLNPVFNNLAHFPVQRSDSKGVTGIGPTFSNLQSKIESRKERDNRGRHPARVAGTGRERIGEARLEISTPGARRLFKDRVQQKRRPERAPLRRDCSTAIVNGEPRVSV